MDRNPTREELASLIKQAKRPLTPEKREILRSNQIRGRQQAAINSVAQKIHATRMRWCKMIMDQMVADKKLPAWIQDPARKKEAADFLEEQGYHWREVYGQPLDFYLMKGDRAVAHLHVNLQQAGFSDAKAPQSD